MFTGLETQSIRPILGSNECKEWDIKSMAVERKKGSNGLHHIV